jgi:hypothetical protein
MNENGKVSINQGVFEKPVTISCQYNGKQKQKTVIVTYDNQLAIECAPTIVGESGTAIALYNSETVQPTWAITQGQQYASIGQDGTISI